MPGRVWERALELATDQHGFITFADLRELGEDPVRLRQWAQRGSVERVGHGIYRFRQIPVTPLTPYALATLWPAQRGVLSHDTALELHELCDINPEQIHVTIPPAHRYRPRRRGGERYVVHHEALGEEQLTWHEGLRIVTPAVAIRQGLEVGVPTHLLRQAISTARQRGLAARTELAALAKRLRERA